MRKFLTTFFAKFLATLCALFMFPILLVVGLVIFLLVIGGDSKRVDRNSATALVLDLSKGVGEFAKSDKLSDIFYGESSPSMYNLISPLYEKHSKLPLLIITGSFANSLNAVNLAQVSELRAGILNYRQRGGQVIAFLQNPSFYDCYLASASNKVIADAFSDFTFKGISIVSPFFGKAFEKYGVKAELVKTGGFKNAAEIFRSDKFSESEKLYMRELLEDIWASVLSDISKTRKISVENLKKIAAEEVVFSAVRAKELSLVDATMTQSEFNAMLKNKYGVDYPDTCASLVEESGIVNMEDKIALVYMSGEITRAGSKGVSDNISSEVYAPLLRKLREDSSVKALVLRIDSGGGDAFASEVIRRELELIAKTKPVVCSIGGTAASGAYWIATAANKIYAQKNSITGSIGVFALCFSAEKLANDFGVTFDSVKTSPHADFMSPTRQMNEFERVKLQSLVDEIFEKFVSLVGKSRKIEKVELLKIADGRVFVGERALKYRLVDKIGGLQDALSEASKLSGCDISKVEQYPQSNFMDEFANFEEGAMPFIKHALPQFSNKIKSALDIVSAKGVYTRMPYDIIIE